MAHSIVAWDPKGEYWDGSLVEDATANVLRARGVAILPVKAGFLSRAGVAGFHKRSWGAGWPLDFAVPRMVCPLTLYIETALKSLHWAIRLVPDARHVGDAIEGKKFTDGILRLAGDMSQGMARLTSVSSKGPPVDAAQLGKSDAYGGWTAIGTGQVHPAVDGYYGFGIYGTMPGVRVAWAAISLTE